MAKARKAKNAKTAEKNRLEKARTARVITGWDENDIPGLIERGALFVISHSAGKDSQAMYLALRDAGVPAEQTLVVYAYLRDDISWEGNAKHIADTIDPGVPFLVAEAVHADGSPKSFWTTLSQREACHARKGRKCPHWPSLTRAGRWCTPDLKAGPIAKVVRKYAKENGYDEIVVCLGIRALESDMRAKDADWAVNTKLTTKPGGRLNRKAWTWHPIKTWSAKDVFEVIAEAGQEPHWVYAKGMRRNSCRFCIYLVPEDFQVAAKLSPEVFERYVEEEKRSGFTLKTNGVAIEEFAGLTVAEAYAAHERIKAGLETAGIPVGLDNPVGDESLPSTNEPCDDWNSAFEAKPKKKKKIIVIDRTAESVAA